MIKELVPVKVCYLYYARSGNIHYLGKKNFYLKENLILFFI
jgi:hypothetical protein